MAGAMLSTPWFVVLTLILYVRGNWLAAHPLVRPLGGPPIVCASVFLLAGPALLETAVAVSTMVSSVALLLCIGIQRLISTNARPDPTTRT
jgi:hypothetical protein